MHPEPGLHVTAARIERQVLHVVELDASAVTPADPQVERRPRIRIEPALVCERLARPDPPRPETDLIALESDGGLDVLVVANVHALFIVGVDRAPLGVLTLLPNGSAANPERQSVRELVLDRTSRLAELVRVAIEHLVVAPAVDDRPGSAAADGRDPRVPAILAGAVRRNLDRNRQRDQQRVETQATDGEHRSLHRVK